MGTGLAGQVAVAVLPGGMWLIFMLCGLLSCTVQL
jgi:hypothetical protein